jgi:hypothetical protein
VTPFFVHPGDLLFSPAANLSFAMPGLVPGINVFVSSTQKSWMAGSSPAMTTFYYAKLFA